MLRVLIVEDEVLIAWGLQIRLEQLGNEVAPIADRAEAAVEVARTTTIDLILMDIMLKGEKTGIDAALEIRGFSDVPIIYLTGNSHLAGDERIEGTRAQGIYAKPPTEAQLLEILELARAGKRAGLDGLT